MAEDLQGGVATTATEVNSASNEKEVAFGEKDKVSTNVEKNNKIAAEKKAKKLQALAMLKAKKMLVPLEQQAVPMLDDPQDHTESN